MNDKDLILELTHIINTLLQEQKEYLNILSDLSKHILEIKNSNSNS